MSTKISTWLSAIKETIFHPSLTVSSQPIAVNSPTFDDDRRRSSSSYPRTDEKLRKELRYFFMNPCQKYKARKRKPWKLIIQISKIFLVTLQLIIFGQNNQATVSFMDDTTEVFQATFLQNQTTFYTKTDMYRYINNIRHQYESLENYTLGNFGFAEVQHSVLCDDEYGSYRIQPNNKTHFHPVTMCVNDFYKFEADLDLGHLNFNASGSNSSCYCLLPWSTMEDSSRFNESLPLHNRSSYRINFHRLHDLELYLGVRTIRMMSSCSYHRADCYDVIVTISFDNSAHTGKILMNMDLRFVFTACPHSDRNFATNPIVILLFALDVTIVIICTISMILCIRSLWRAQRLKKSFVNFYRRREGKELNWTVKLEFFNGWYLLIIISDLLTILGSLDKGIIELEWKGEKNFDACSLFLGIGCLCVWIGVLRYAGFFHQYNILVLTMKKCLPHVLRFIVCASVLYLGFLFCGWVVLAPYHHKFRNPTVTSEALYSLINGDDMYMTFEEMSKKSKLAWTFSQVYLYAFISLFIYVVLSLFIAVIMETYETIKEWQSKDFPPQNEVQKFLAEHNPDDGDEFDYDFTSDVYCCYCLYHNNGPDIECESGDEEMTTA